jgi:hypothetical protein
MIALAAPGIRLYYADLKCRIAVFWIFCKEEVLSPRRSHPPPVVSGTGPDFLLLLLPAAAMVPTAESRR